MHAVQEVPAHGRLMAAMENDQSEGDARGGIDSAGGEEDNELIGEVGKTKGKRQGLSQIVMAACSSNASVSLLRYAC